MVDTALLKELAEVFSPEAKLYAVGGFCRDVLLGVAPRDLDICSKLKVEDVKTLLKSSGFVVSDKCLRLGTVIVRRGNFRAEYTTFRTDSYPENSGMHAPSSVVFTDDIEADSARRDFCCNAVYYDVTADLFVDPRGGVDDIRKRVLRAADIPGKVFGEDGLRVLRMVRFAAELGFDVEENTYLAAKENARLVLDIKKERIFEELDKIFKADTAYPALNAEGHCKGLLMLDDLGLVDVLLPELAALKGLEQSAKYHVYDAYRHSLEAYRVSSPEIRWAALLHDVGKRIAVDLQGNMHGHDSLGAEAVRTRLAELGMPPSRMKRVAELVACHMVDLKGDMSENKLRRFIVAHSAVMKDLIALKYADCRATTGHDAENLRIDRLYREMRTDGTPFSLADLPVDGNDAERAGLKGKAVGEALKLLFDEAVVNPSLRDRARATEFLLRRAKAGE